jgi:hypothetical protein
MKTKSYVKFLLSVGFFTFTGAFLFQNCGLTKGSFQVQEGLIETASTAQPEAGLFFAHPAQKEIEGVTQKFLVVNRDYIEGLFRENFTASNGEPAPSLESLLNKWVITRGAQHGLGCDPNSSYSGTDCGGNVTAANLPVFVDHSAIREAFMLQLCEGILGTDEGLDILLSKTEVKDMILSEPDILSIKRIYFLFFRSMEGSTAFSGPLIELDSILKIQGESLRERWRAISVEICEAPGWQKI